MPDGRASSAFLFQDGEVGLIAVEIDTAFVPAGGGFAAAQEGTGDGQPVAVGRGHFQHAAMAQGQPVRAGDRIALVGQSGRATGPHLHFEVRVGEIATNPLPMLPEIPR